MVQADTLPSIGEDSAKRFRRLADQWRAESAHLSSLVEMAILPSYQQIIGMGPEVLPLIMRELRSDPDYWFWALQAITGCDPVPPESRGKLAEMADQWLKWGREHGYA